MVIDGDILGGNPEAVGPIPQTTAPSCPLVTSLVREELAAYLTAVGDATVQSLPTRCPPWTVRDLTTHLAVTFRRFANMLEQSRAGDLSPPFAREQLTAINLQEVEYFTGDPLGELQTQAERFLLAATDSDEVVGHQRGPIPAELQVLFGSNALALHRRPARNRRRTSSLHR